jgi:hypothetical protein
MSSLEHVLQVTQRAHTQQAAACSRDWRVLTFCLQQQAGPPVPFPSCIGGLRVSAAPVPAHAPPSVT